MAMSHNTPGNLLSGDKAFVTEQGLTQYITDGSTVYNFFFEIADSTELSVFLFDDTANSETEQVQGADYILNINDTLITFNIAPVSGLILTIVMTAPNVLNQTFPANPTLQDALDSIERQLISDGVQLNRTPKLIPTFATQPELNPAGKAGQVLTVSQTEDFFEIKDASQIILNLGGVFAKQPLSEGEIVKYTTTTILGQEVAAITNAGVTRAEASGQVIFNSSVNITFEFDSSVSDGTRNVVLDKAGNTVTIKSSPFAGDFIVKGGNLTPRFIPQNVKVAPENTDGIEDSPLSTSEECLFTQFDMLPQAGNGIFNMKAQLTGSQYTVFATEDISASAGVLASSPNDPDRIQQYTTVNIPLKKWVKGKWEQVFETVKGVLVEVFTIFNGMTNSAMIANPPDTALVDFRLQKGLDTGNYFLGAAYSVLPDTVTISLIDLNPPIGQPPISPFPVFPEGDYTLGRVTQTSETTTNTGVIKTVKQTQLIVDDASLLTVINFGDQPVETYNIKGILSEAQLVKKMTLVAVTDDGGGGGTGGDTTLLQTKTGSLTDILVTYIEATEELNINEGEGRIRGVKYVWNNTQVPLGDINILDKKRIGAKYLVNGNVLVLPKGISPPIGATKKYIVFLNVTNQFEIEEVDAILAAPEDAFSLILQNSVCFSIFEAEEVAGKIVAKNFSFFNPARPNIDSNSIIGILNEPYAVNGLQTSITLQAPMPPIFSVNRLFVTHNQIDSIDAVVLPFGAPISGTTERFFLDTAARTFTPFVTNLPLGFVSTIISIAFRKETGSVFLRETLFSLSSTFATATDALNNTLELHASVKELFFNEIIILYTDYRERALTAEIKTKEFGSVPIRMKCITGNNGVSVLL